MSADGMHRLFLETPGTPLDICRFDRTETVRLRGHRSLRERGGCHISLGGLIVCTAPIKRQIALNTAIDYEVKGLKLLQNVNVSFRVWIVPSIGAEGGGSFESGPVFSQKPEDNNGFRN